MQFCSYLHKGTIPRHVEYYEVNWRHIRAKLEQEVVKCKKQPSHCHIGSPRRDVSMHSCRDVRATTSRRGRNLKPILVLTRRDVKSQHEAQFQPT